MIDARSLESDKCVSSENDSATTYGKRSCTEFTRPWTLVCCSCTREPYPWQHRRIMSIFVVGMKNEFLQKRLRRRLQEIKMALKEILSHSLEIENIILSPRKSRNFFGLICNCLKLQLPLRRSYLHLNLHFCSSHHLQIRILFRNLPYNLTRCSVVFESP